MLEDDLLIIVAALGEGDGGAVVEPLVDPVVDVDPIEVSFEYLTLQWILLDILVGRPLPDEVVIRSLLEVSRGHLAHEPLQVLVVGILE